MKNFLEKVKKEESTFFTYEEIEKHPIGEKVEIIEGIFTERLQSRYNVLFFKVTQKKGTIIPENYHDCLEDLVIGEGVLRENVSGKILNKYDMLVIDINQPHITEALTDCVWYAHLYK